MNHEPVNPDDPQLSAYALGELSLSERAEFEAQLELSPNAQRELESMEDMMSLLSGGLKEEWCSELKQPALEVLPSVKADEVIVSMPSSRSRRGYQTAAAAAVAALMLAGAAFVSNQSGVDSSEGYAVQEASTEASLVASADELSMFASSSGVAVPQLFLTEAVESTGSGDLAEALQNLDDLSAPVDASYLESEVVMPASKGLSLAGTGIVPAGMTKNSANDRVDSYLPPVDGVPARLDQKSGLIEGRMNAIASSDPHLMENQRSVFVRGYVAMDGSGSADASAKPGRVLAGFRPVSIIGNPVKNTEVDLKLISDFQTIQNELTRIVESLPEDSEQRQQLEALVGKNRKAVSLLKSEFTR